MKTKNGLTKDIEFNPRERMAVSERVKKLLARGWWLQEGKFEQDGLIHGDEVEGGEQIQLHRNLFS